MYKNNYYPAFNEVGKLKGVIPLMDIPQEMIAGNDRVVRVPLLNRETAQKLKLSAGNDRFLLGEDKRRKVTRPYCPAADIAWGSIAVNPQAYKEQFFGAVLPVADYYYDRSNRLTLGRPEMQKVLVKFTGEVMSSLLLQNSRLIIGSPLVCFGIIYEDGIGYHFGTHEIAFSGASVFPIRDFNWNSNPYLYEKKQQIIDLFHTTPVVFSNRIRT